MIDMSTDHQQQDWNVKPALALTKHKLLVRSVVFGNHLVKETRNELEILRENATLTS